MWKWISLLIILVAWVTWSVTVSDDTEERPQEEAVLAQPVETVRPYAEYNRGSPNSMDRDNSPAGDFTVTVTRPRVSSGF